MTTETCAVCNGGPHGDNRYVANVGEHAYTPRRVEQPERLTRAQREAEDAFYNAPRGRRGRERS